MPPLARLKVSSRIAWTILSLTVVQMVVCGLAAAPIVWFWYALGPVIGQLPAPWDLLLVSMAIVPSYAVFALLLMMVSALATWVTGWRTPPDAEMRIAEFGWPLLDWVRHMVSIHVVRVLAGSLYRSTPLWTAYLRLSGARMGRRVYVNSLSMSDYNLIECGDDVIVGADAHISGHTVERGVVKTARVRFGRNVTVGLGSVVHIGVEVEDNCQIAALAVVPKYSRLQAGWVYAGIPARPVVSTARARAAAPVSHDPAGT